jgi:hypothetical protein
VCNEDFHLSILKFRNIDCFWYTIFLYSRRRTHAVGIVFSIAYDLIVKDEVLPDKTIPDVVICKLFVKNDSTFEVIR